MRLRRATVELLLLRRSGPTDSVAPSLSSAQNGTETADGTTNFGVTTDEANGTLYWAILTNGGTATDAQIKAGSGGNIVAGKAGSQAVTTTGAQTVASVTGLTASTDYEIVFLHRDAAGNDSAQATVGLTTTTTLTDAAASITATDITVTATSSGSLEGGPVFGVEYIVQGAGGSIAGTSYTFAENTTGLAANQSITIGAGQGVASGATVGIRPYYNLDSLDPTETRVYGNMIAPFVLAGAAPSGTTTEGDTLTAMQGIIAGGLPLTVTRAWKACDGAGENCSALGSSAATFVLTADEVGDTIRVNHLAENTAGSDNEDSAASGVVAAAGPVAGYARWYQSGVGMSAAAWEDQSVAGNDLAQATGANQPDVSAGGEFLSFVAANADRMLNTWERVQPFTIGMRVRIDTWTTNTGIWGSRFTGCRGIMSPTTSKSAIYANSTSAGSTDIGVGSWASVVWVVDGASSVISVDGTETTELNPGTRDMSYLVIGAQSDGGNPSDISVAEVVTYASALDATDRAALIAYLNTINPT